MDNAVNLVLITSLFTAGVRLAAPLFFTALGGIASERSGVVNIGLEGMMVMGTFGGYIGSLWTGSSWGGVLGGMVTGGFAGLLFAVICVVLQANQVVIGTGINILALGLVSFLYRAMYRSGISQFVSGFKIWAIPVLSDIPVLGDIFFKQNPLVYIAYLLIPVLSWILYRTTWGLKLRSVGELPRAADTAGIPVWRVRILAVTISGMLAGIGGAFLSIGELSAFTEGLVAGRGFIALAAVIFGRWDPLRTAGACFLFGLADALQLRLQALGVPISYEFLLMFPYLLTFLTFVLSVNRSKAPAALGKPYPETRG